MRFTLFILALGLLASCSSDNENLGSPQGFMSDDEFLPTVQPELRPFYIAFEEEAAARGITIDLTQEMVTGNIVELGNNSLAGICRQVPGENDRVAIDIGTWNSASFAFRETIVFHELGHCILDRDHLDAQTDGICNSIMHSGLTGCEIPLDDPVLREQYLDELFAN